MKLPWKKASFSDFDLRKLDLTRKYDDDFSEDEGIPWRDHLLLYVCALLMLIFIIWASFSTLDEVVRGDGVVIPSSNVQVIQSLEGGIIDAILVKEGDVVDAGKTLVQLRNITARSELETGNKKYYGLLAAVIRLQAEADGRTPEFPADVVAMASESAAAEKAAYDANQKRMESDIGILREQLVQKNQEITELEKRISDTSKGLSLAQAQRKLVAPMVERGSSSKMELLQIDRDIAGQEATLNGFELSLPRAKAAVEEMENRISGQVSNFRAEAQRQLSEKTVELNVTRETLTALKDKSLRTEITSPVRGAVKDIKVRSVGGVAKPGETIMEIVPLEDQLVIESRVRPSDIAFIYPTQKAVVRLSAYDFSVYGSLEGRVSDISPDTIVNERGESFYRVKIRTAETKLEKNGKELNIIPGMQATVDIVTGEKTVMKYLLKPFIKASQTALTER